MRKIFLLLAIIWAGVVHAQAPVTIAQPYKFLKWLQVHDSIRANIYFQGTVDTMATRAYARQFGGSGSGVPLAGYGIKITGTDTVNIDTLHYRKMDSLYVVTDSTFIIKINGVAYAYKMRGSVFSFNGRTAAVVPQDNDYAAFYPKLDSTYNDPTFISHLSFSKMQNLPNTLAGYNIGDAVKNAGGGRSWASDVFANRPAFGNLGSFFLATDSNAIYYDNGAGWTKVTTAGGGGSAVDSAVLAGNLMLKSIAGTNITLRVDTNALKSFISTLTGISQIFSKRGILISGTDSVGVDSSVVIPYTDTLTLGRMVTKSFLAGRGFLTSETDPVATAKTITLTGTAAAGISITGVAGQTLGSGPSWIFKADTALLATNTNVNRQGFIKANQTITLSGVVAGSGTTAITTTFGTNVLNYANFQQVAASSLVGNPTGSLGNAQGVTIQSPLIFNSNILKFDTTVIHTTAYNNGLYLVLDSIRVINKGAAGLNIGYGAGTDSFFLSKLVQGSNITLTKNSDSSITIAASSGFTNPMTTVGDIIVGGTSGAATRQGIGANGTFWGVQSGVAGYFTPPGNVTSVGAANASLIVTPTSGNVLASINPAFTDSFTVIQKFAAGINLGGTLTLLSTTHASGALNGKLQALVRDTTSGQGIVYQTSYQGMDTTGLNKNQGWMPFYDTTCHCWKVEAPPSGGGGTGNTNSNVGIGYRLAIPLTNNIKTITNGIGLLFDSATTNQIGLKADSSYLMTVASRQFITGEKDFNGVVTLPGITAAASALNGKLGVLVTDTTASNKVYRRSFQGMDTTNLGKNQGWQPYYDTTCNCWKVQAPPGFANPMTTLGDIIYFGTTTSRLPGNTTAGLQVLGQTGTGTVSAAPAWHSLVKADVGLSSVENTALSTWGGSANIVTLGTIAAGIWQGSVVTGAFGGTGINNSGKTITLGGNLVTSGANSLTFTTTGATNVTLPTSGTLVNSSVTSLSSLAGVGTVTSGTWQAGIVGAAFGGTGINNGTSTITLGGPLVHVGAFTTTITSTGTTGITLPTSGTLYGTQSGSISSAQLLASLSDETGTGAAVFATSPSFGGTPLVPTAALGTNTTQAASTAFVIANQTITTIGAFDSQSPSAAGMFYDGVHTLYTQAATASFPGMVTIGAQTLAGVKTFTSSPVVPTPSFGDASTKAASTQFVSTAISGVSNAFNGYQAISSGTSGTINKSNVAFTFSTGISSYNLTTPASPVDGMTFDIDCNIFNGNQIGALTLTANTGSALIGLSPFVTTNNAAASTATAFPIGSHIHGQYFAGGTQGPVWFVKFN